VDEAAELATLPIFPLAVVLVPGELLPLHIFEERYKAMMAFALEGEKRFGLSYHARAEVGRDAVPPPGSVGCLAHITAVAPLAGGRLNMLAVGAGRYVVRRYTQHEPFLIAEVDPLSDAPGDAESLAPLADEVRSLFRRLAAAARTISDESSDQSAIDLDVEPELLSFVVAGNISLDADVKRQLLEMTDTYERLDRLRGRMNVMVDTLEYRAEMHGLVKKNGHGRKLPGGDAS
jgi:ATP-dependent Lon protease